MLQELLISPTAKLDISLLVESSSSPSPPSPATIRRPSNSRSYSTSVSKPDAHGGTSSTVPAMALAVRSTNAPRQPHTGGPAPLSVPATSSKRNASVSPQEARQSNKKSTRQWSKEENVLLRELKERDPPLKWDDIAEEFDNRSSTACRLRYQNYMERKAEWTDIEKETLARLYEREKQKMWSGIAQELGIPWRAVEYMHWEIGQETMADLAGARLLHPVRASGGGGGGDPSSATHASPMQSVFPPMTLHYQNTNPFMAQHHPSNNNNSSQLPPSTTNGGGPPASVSTRTITGDETTGFAHHRRNRQHSQQQQAQPPAGLPGFRPGSSTGPLPSLAEFDRSLSAYASPGVDYRHRHRGGGGGDEDVAMDDDEEGRGKGGKRGRGRK